MDFILDSVTDGIAKLEDEEGNFIEISADELGDCHEGDVFSFENGVYRFNPDKTIERKKIITEKRRNLLRKMNTKGRKLCRK